MLEAFERELAQAGGVEAVRGGLIGEGIPAPGPFGEHPLVYADYVASGRALRQVEAFVAERVLPFYANSHTEASYCGAYMTRLREAARAYIANKTGADEGCAVIFTGAGATAAVNRLVALTGITEAVARGERPCVFHGPYEHHSNILPWRESGAEVCEIPEAEDGGPDLAALEAELAARADCRLKVGAFSAASNVTGVLTDADAVTRVLKRHGALALWDYAGGGPYLPIRMSPSADAQKDAVFLSPHKFPGGPGASGLLIVRESAVAQTRPSWPGGGSVTFVSPWGHDYSTRLHVREEAGTPNVIGDIRAALAFAVKAACGAQVIAARNAELNARALARWRGNPWIELLGVDRGERLPIFSFRVRTDRGGFVHHQLFCRMLSDLHGIQARGGCACAGPYAHRLLNIDKAHSEAMRRAIQSGAELEKPGWVRLNFSYLMDDAKAAFIVESVDRLAHDAPRLAEEYLCDPKTARFRHEEMAA